MSDRPMVNVYEGDPPVLVYREMNDDEYAEWTAAQDATATAALESERARVARSVLARLVETDAWVLRAYEEGKSLSDARVGYREVLRGLRAQALAAATPDDLAAITIPDPPPWNAA